MADIQRVIIYNCCDVFPTGETLSFVELLLKIVSCPCQPPCLSYIAWNPPILDFLPCSIPFQSSHLGFSCIFGHFHVSDSETLWVGCNSEEKNRNPFSFRGSADLQRQEIEAAIFTLGFLNSIGSLCTSGNEIVPILKALHNSSGQ